MRIFAFIVLTIVSLAHQKNTANAAIVYGYSVGPDLNPTGFWDGSEIIVNVNALTTINVFMIGTPGDTRLTDEGVNNFEFRLEYNQDVGFLDSPEQQDVDDQWDLEFLAHDTSQPFAALEMGGSGTLSMQAITPVRPATGTDFVRLGKFRYEANVVGTTVFTLNDRQPDPASPNNLLGNNSAIDDELFPANTGGVNPTFRITAVPEPSSAVVSACVALIGLRIRRKRSNKAVHS